MDVAGKFSSKLINRIRKMNETHIFQTCYREAYISSFWNIWSPYIGEF